jgi:hypothetical protein
VTRVISFDDFTCDERAQESVATRFRQIEGAADLAQPERSAGIVEMEENVERLLDSGGPGHGMNLDWCST